MIKTLRKGAYIEYKTSPPDKNEIHLDTVDIDNPFDLIDVWKEIENLLEVNFEIPNRIELLISKSGNYYTNILEEIKFSINNLKNWELVLDNTKKKERKEDGTSVTSNMSGNNKSNK